MEEEKQGVPMFQKLNEKGLLPTDQDCRQLQFLIKENEDKNHMF